MCAVCKMQKAESVRKELAVLDAKRSNVINIGLTVLPPPNTIKAAILKMDSAIMNREGIEVRYSYFLIFFYLLHSA